MNSHSCLWLPHWTGKSGRAFQHIHSQRVQPLFQASCMDMKPLNDRLHSDSKYKKTSDSTFLLIHYSSPHFNRGHVDTLVPQIAPDISSPVGLVSPSLARSLFTADWDNYSISFRVHRKKLGKAFCCIASELSIAYVHVHIPLGNVQY